ncbi:RND transporter [Novimethylophilus kurashikiensis]|uniref:RND transporter n=1 Tax=Novimethylophilus kurashikiensis TaxID=1825523 RepID=A0A2R5F3P3_9PROT|nr:efflux RND transporter periplasmic adaptor subunit [Novimethylophilus kurashikiensis]GBG13087.1 RND transporter [Novimethylophilus kurashikiensis]
MKTLIQIFSLLLAVSSAIAAPLATAPVASSGSNGTYTAEGVVEAVKSSLIAAQVTGSVTALTVKAGDTVKAGQLLARIDTRLAAQQVATNQAQVVAAQAQLAAARKEYERKQRLYDKQYISQAALERAEADFKAAQAQTQAQTAQSGMASVQTGLHAIYAPYSGVIAEVMTEVGNMAMPDKPLIAMYEPRAMRVVANVPQSVVAKLKQQADIQVEIPGAVQGRMASRELTVLPMADAVSHVVQVRIGLPGTVSGLKPGMFSRAALPMTESDADGKLSIPASAVLRRSELNAVYVVDKQGRPQLRQVRLGRQLGDRMEVLAGVEAGEQVALDPIAAAKAVQP